MKLLFMLLFFILSAHAHEGKFHLFQKNWQGREVHVYLPEGYAASQSKFPVLYMHDGQNAYDLSRAFMGQTWNTENTLTKLISENLIVPLVVVAIDNRPSRLYDYTHDEDLDVPGGGGAENYLGLIEKDLIPLVERHIKVRTDAASRGIIGSSLGGLVSLYAGISRGTFKRVGALSPSLWWNDLSVIRLMSERRNLPDYLYVDSGTIGGERAEDVRFLFREIENLGLESNTKMVIEDGGQHREGAWARRLPLALKHLFPR